MTPQFTPEQPRSAGKSADGQLAAIDGKTARATLDRTKVKNPLHLVSAWANEAITGGIEKKRLQAAWNDQGRETLLGLFVEI